MMAIDLEGLSVERIIVHHIFKRTSERKPTLPKLGISLTHLPLEALDAFQRRITEALGRRSHGIEMNIAESKANSFFQGCASSLEASEAEFIQLSQDMAKRLAKVQASKDLAASKLIVVTGRAGQSSMPYIAVIKAELQDGFSTNTDDSINHIKNLFLTPTQRLYKIGFVHRIVSAPSDNNGLYDARNFQAFLFDHLLTRDETRKAAHYFYSEFLGMEVLSSDRKKTRDFFELTKNFIHSSEIDQESKIDLLDALRTELKSNRATIRTEDFANDYMNENLRRSYLAFMEKKEFSDNAFTKDLEFIKNKLRKRQKMSFICGVEVSAPPDKLHQLVKVESTDAEKTVLIIRSPIQSQE